MQILSVNGKSTSFTHWAHLISSTIQGFPTLCCFTDSMRGLLTMHSSRSHGCCIFVVLLVNLVSRAKPSSKPCYLTLKDNFPTTLRFTESPEEATHYDSKYLIQELRTTKVNMSCDTTAGGSVAGNVWHQLRQPSSNSHFVICNRMNHRNISVCKIVGNYII